MKGRLYKRLSCDFGKILEDGDRYDVVIEVGELPINQSYNVHSIILRHRCPSLYKELNEISLDTSDVKTIYKPHISTKAFTIIIKYIYCGKRAIKNFHHEQGGPAFGSLDFQLEGNFKTGKSGYCLRYDYETPIRSERSFSVKDYEVFQ
ncbi:16608_t:CDS:2, partial [Acaulospora morrowiae]